MVPMHPRWFALAVFGPLVLASFARAEFAPNVRPQLEVTRASGPIEIDGRLDDEGWRTASRATGWHQTWPGYNTEPAFGLQAWITYDDENLYFAIVVTEDDPTKVRASHRDRDAIFRDDYVGLLLDTYGTGAWAYELFVNPYGIQGDLRWSQRGEDVGFDLIWQTEGRITDDGWLIEGAIPFRSLRFPDRTEQVWRANFWYNRPRESRERYSWSAADRDNPCWTCTWGTLTGIRDVSAGGALEILPTITGFTASALQDPGDPTSRFGEIDSDADFGVGLRYGLSSSYAAEATFNPDFSQVESDAAQIDANTTFALFFPERRPFFQEGSDLFGTNVNAVYTRSINNPQWAGKLTGRTQKSSVALLAARDEDSPLILPFEERSAIFALGRSTSVIGRARRALHEDSFVGALGTFRAFDEGGARNAVFGADGMFRFLENFQVEGQWLFSHTTELDDPALGRDRFVDPDTDELLRFGHGDDTYTALLDGEEFGGHASYASLEYSTRFWDWDFDWWRTSPTFRADNGFVTQNDNERVSFVTSGRVQPNNALLDEMSAFLMVARVWNFGGERKDEWIRPQIGIGLKGQTNVEIGYLTSNENFRDVQHDGIQRWEFEVNSNYSHVLSGGFEVELGDFVARRAPVARLGDGRRFDVWATFRPTDRFTLEPVFSWQRLEDPVTGSTDVPGFFEGYVARARMNYQFSRAFFARLILQYNEFQDSYDVEPLLTYRVNPFTSFYVGSAHRLQDFDGYTTEDGRDGFGLEQTDRVFFAKVQYFLRR
jgi:hypothetical protein